MISSATRKWRQYSEYRPSGIEWLGEVPEGWEVRRIKTALTRNDGGVWGEDSDDGGTIVLRSTEQTVDGKWNISEPARRKLTVSEYYAAVLKEGDLIITKSSGSSLHIGKTSIVTKEVAALNCCYSNFMQRLRVDRHNYPKFLWYVLNGDIGRKQFDYLSNTTTGLANLNTEVIGNVVSSFPSLPEQRAIAAFLDREAERIDALINKKERQIELLQEKYTALISHTVTKGLNPDVKMRPSGIEWLGAVPEHWEARRLKYVSSVNDDVLAENTDPDFELLYVDISSVDSASGIQNKELMRFESAPSRARRQVRNGDVIVSTVRTYLRAIAPIDKPDPNLIVSTGFAVIRPKNGLNSQFASYALRASYFVDSIVTRSVGVSYPAINANDLVDLSIALPPLSEQRAIAAFLDRETAQIDVLSKKIQKSIEKLREFRTALISAAVTGKIDVGEEVD